MLYSIKKEEKTNYYGLLKSGFSPKPHCFFRDKPLYNPFPDIIFYNELEFRCSSKEKIYQTNYPAQILGFIAKRATCDELGQIWEIYTYYGDHVDTYLHRPINGITNDYFLKDFRKNYGKYVDKYPVEAYFLYIITSHNRFGYKIGITNNPESRLRVIGTDLPFKTSIIRLYTFYPEYIKKVEKLFHFLFSEKKLNGEWFDLDLNDIDLIDYLYEGGKIVVKEDQFEKYKSFLHRNNFKLHAKEYWDKIFKVEQNWRHYMTLMDYDNYNQELLELKIKHLRDIF